MSSKPVFLCILDGWGLRDDSEGNAVALANTPTYDRLMADCPNATLVTFGPDVGLPEGQMGNSEVGHMNIGAGRVVEMDLVRIDRVMREGTFGNMAEVQDFVAKTKAGSGRTHLLGMLSDGGVHGHIDHIIASTKSLTGSGLEVALHLFTDGRDVGPVTAQGYLDQLQDKMPEGAFIATICGRYYAMDRDKRWDRVERAYKAMVAGEAAEFATAGEALAVAYSNDITDEFIEPSVIGSYSGFADGDSLLITNFRADRAREILSAIGAPDFDGFKTGARKSFSTMAGFTSYSDVHDTFMSCVFTKPALTNTLGEWIAKHGKSQFRIAETEKYPHVTFFLNGGEEAVSEGEDRYLAPSPKVATYDLQPEMSAAEVTDNLIAAFERGYDLLVVNYANPDMVGHTGDLQAAIAAVEAVDQGVSKLLAAADAAGASGLIIADHGNCETMIDPETGGPHTAHTTNLVPVILYGEQGTIEPGRLADIAPTLLNLMGLAQPSEMTGKCLRVS